MLRKFFALLLIPLLLIGLLEGAPAEEKKKYKYYKNGLGIGTIEGYDTGKDWFGEDVHYDIADETACWELLQRPITVLNAGEKEAIYPLDAPNGKKVVNEWQGGFINGGTAAVHVLGEDEGGWTKIEGLDYYNRIIRGYVRTKLLKTVTPRADMGIIIDKLAQRLYLFRDGKLWSSVAVSTGLVNEEQPYNETAAGEYLIGSWVGGFDSEGMYCEMGIRFNGGDLLHMVPYITLKDGTKRHTTFEALLGQKASHGCVRVARIASEEGLNIRWLWDNLKKNTKVVIWDDAGRVLPYPEDNLPLYYNPNGGQNYHSLARCSVVREKYLPLTGFTYGQLDTAPYDRLTPCASCSPAKRKSEIDKMNQERGVLSMDEAMQDAQMESENTNNATSTDLPDPQQDIEAEETNGGTQHSVEINILPPSSSKIIVYE